MVSNQSLVKSSDVVESTISDHFLVYTVLNLKVPKPPVTSITIRSFKNYNAEEFCNDISTVPWDTVNLLQSLDEKLEGFNDLFLTCLDTHAPNKTIKLKHKPKPFFTAAIKEAILRREKQHKQAKFSNSPEAWMAFKECRREVKHAIHDAETKYYKQQIIDNKNNSSSIWKTIRSALPRKAGRDVSYTTDTKLLAEEFNHYFVSVGEKTASDSVELAKAHDLDTSEFSFSMQAGILDIPEKEQFQFRPVCADEVSDLISKMPKNKAPGYDKVSIRVIQDCLPYIVPSLVQLFNTSFATNTFPCVWKKSEIVPHLKDGDHEQPSNNRPISLLPALSKVLERIALDQFLDFLISRQRLSSHQSGNKKLHSTETLGLLVTDNIFRAMDAKKLTLMVLIDLSKAFDSISHSILLSKIQNLGASASALKWFESYLSDREQTTRIGPSLSSPLTVTHGVPQGSILGPVLFNLYINDLPKVVKHCQVESYVDDSKLYISISPKEIEDGLSKVSTDLRRVAQWCCAHSLLINPNKTKIMLFGTSQNTCRVPDITIDFLGQQLKPATSCKDLGIVLDPTLSFNDHISSLTSSLLASLCQISRVKHLFPKDILCIVLNSLIFSKLFYCSTVWSGTSRQNINKLQLVQNFAARILTGIRKFDHITPSLKELGWLSVEDQLRIRDATMVFKCVKGLAPDYLTQKLSSRSQVHSYNTRRNSDFNVPFCRTKTAQRSFFYHAVNTFNSMKSDTKNAESLRTFKRKARAEFNPVPR